MIFFKIIQKLLLPSVFVLILILAGTVLWLKKRKIGKILLILGILLYYLFSITPVADLILMPLEGKYQKVQKEELNQADKIVFLLGGRESNVLRASEVLRIYFLKEKPVQIIISGRDLLNSKREEAKRG